MRTRALWARVGTGAAALAGLVLILVGLDGDYDENRRPPSALGSEAGAAAGLVGPGAVAGAPVDIVPVTRTIRS